MVQVVRSAEKTHRTNDVVSVYTRQIFTYKNKPSRKKKMGTYRTFKNAMRWKKIFEQTLT